MQIHNISEHNSVLNTFISEIRSVAIQKDQMRFRRNMERIGEILAYEMSKFLTYQPQNIKGSLGSSRINLPVNNIVLCSILRAGIPLHNGLLNFFDATENAFVSAYRKHKKNPKNFDIVVEYLACPSLENKTLVLADPMLATGQSIVATLEALKPFGTPKEIHLISVIGAKDGIAFVNKYLPNNTHLWIAAIDEILNENGYIIPGLGDAGDLSFGNKLDH